MKLDSCLRGNDDLPKEKDDGQETDGCRSRRAPLGDVPAWVAAVRGTITKLDELSAQARTSAELFSVERMVQSTEQLYTMLLARKGVRLRKEVAA